MFSGVGKTSQEMDAALEASILMFNVESEGEFDLIETGAHPRNARNIAIRINPDMEAETHQCISTGQNIHKLACPKRKRRHFTVALRLSTSQHHGIAATSDRRSFRWNRSESAR